MQATTYDFEALKSRAIALALDRLRHSCSLAAVQAPGAGQRDFWDVHAAYHVLVPAAAQSEGGGNEGLAKVGDNLEELAKAVERRIKAWDVRAVGNLIDVFPSIAPSALRYASIKAFVADDEEGRWKVHLDPAGPRRRNALLNDEVFAETRALNMVAGEGHRLATFMPVVHEAQKFFNDAVEQLERQTRDRSVSGMEATEGFQSARDRFNAVLRRAAQLFTLDTAPYNQWSHVQQAYAPDQAHHEPGRLWFQYMDGFNPPSKIAERLQQVADDLVNALERKGQRDQDESNARGFERQRS